MTAEQSVNKATLCSQYEFFDIQNKNAIKRELNEMRFDHTEHLCFAHRENEEDKYI
jgi:hypothetical protein